MVMANETAIEQFERKRREAQERERDLRDIPVRRPDKSRWPKGIRSIALDEEDGLGIDRDGRLHWDGKPVEIIGQRLDLTKTQIAIAAVVAGATVVTALATVVQGWTAYHDWACKVGWPTFVSCPQKPAAPNPADFPG
jgi:hypothetical protein